MNEEVLSEEITVEETSIWDEIAEFLKKISVYRHIFDIIGGYNEVYDILNQADIKNSSRILKFPGGLSDMYLGSKDIDIDDPFGSIKSIKGLLQMVTGLGKTVSSFEKPTPINRYPDIPPLPPIVPKKINVFGIVDMIYGGAGYVNAVIEINQFTEDTEDKDKWSAYCKAAAGASRALAGYCKATVVLKPLGDILGIFSGVCSFSAYVFEKWGMTAGMIVLAIGTGLTVVLACLMKGELIGMFTSFNSLATPLTINPLTAVAGLALIVAMGILLTKKLASIPYLAQGGFPAYGQTFIAREAGPELVGTLQGRNAVVNNGQIVEAVSAGVYRTFNDALRNKNSKAVARVFLDGKCIAMSRQA